MVTVGSGGWGWGLVVSLLENVSAPSGGSSDRCSSDGQMCEDHLPDSLWEEEPLGIDGPWTKSKIILKLDAVASLYYSPIQTQQPLNIACVSDALRAWCILIFTITPSEKWNWFHFVEGKNRGSEKIRKLPKVMLWLSCGFEIWMPSVWFQNIYPLVSVLS